MRTERPPRLNPADSERVRALLAQVAERDGREPLSDQALTRLADDAAEHVLVVEGDQVVGYAQLDGSSLELAELDHGAAGLLLDEFAGRPVLVWTHGEHSRLTEPLTERGYLRQRELFQLCRPLPERPETPEPAEGLELRPFELGQDEADWLAVNAAAFAYHPEQGGWTRRDLDARESEPWFDPAGLLMAWRGDELAGFHWTKIHPDGTGEVYVLAVAPQAQGLRLGSLLLRAGLASLYDRGVREVLLYVDGDNTDAVRLYQRYGFTRHDLDVQWRAP